MQYVVLLFIMFFPQLYPLFLDSYIIMMSLNYLITLGTKFFYKTIDFKNSQFNQSRYSFILELLSMFWMVFQIILFSYSFQNTANINSDDSNSNNENRQFNYSFVFVTVICIFVMIYYYFPYYGCAQNMKGPRRWDYKIGNKQKIKKTNFQKVLELYSLVENKISRF